MKVYITRKTEQNRTKVILKHRHGSWLFPAKSFSECC